MVARLFDASWARCCGDVLLERVPGIDPEHTGEIISLGREHLGVSSDKLEEVAGEREVLASLFFMLPPQHGPG